MKVGIKSEVTPKNLHIFAAVVNVGMMLGLPEVVITSGTDSVHKVGSLHYTGNALDIRTFIYRPEMVGRIIGSLQVWLGNDYEVILEKDHIHIEYDPKHENHDNPKIA